MSKTLSVMYLVSFFIFLSLINALPPGTIPGDRPCYCYNHDEDEWCKQWCGEDVNGLCLGEVIRWGCWCRNPGYSWICDCGYWIICEDFYSRYVGASCDHTYCGLLDP